MSKKSKTIKGWYSQQGYADLLGLKKSTISGQCKISEETDNKILDIYYTEDGKRIIKADPKVVTFYQKKNEHKLKKS